MHHLVGVRARVDHRAHPGGPGELVDPVVRPPGEAVPGLPGGHQEGDSGAHRVERGPVVHVELHTADGLPLELGEGGREVRLPEAHSRQADVVRGGGPASVDALGAQQFERAGGAAPFGEVRALEQAGPRVHQRALRRGHVRARRHPGQPVGVVELRPLPARHRHRLQRHRRRQELAVEEQRQLGDRHAVRLRDRLPPDEGRELLVQDRAEGLPSGHRVRAVQDHEPLPREPGRLHAVEQRPDVRVEARAHVLDVEDDGVHAGRREHVSERLPALQVRVVDRQPGGGVVVAALGAARLRRTAEAVLGAEDGGQVHPVVGVHDVDDVAHVPGDAGRVGDDADLLSVEPGVAVVGEALEAGAQPAAPASVARGCRVGRARRGGGGAGRHRGRRGEQVPSGQRHAVTSVIAAGVMRTHANPHSPARGME
ncbi:hypothetical protein [Streptomyces coelicolor A3(2)]|uniref:Uncharacterized protein n=1 Tax=Streptomyces coelicolor (strain ATCC BAA-471 / A3(2) / M145) TaxID=100226 RepID=Q9S259_STRCO|nr:hypothetical protein [Streptomyces coelicolor A3(2)]